MEKERLLKLVKQHSDKEAIGMILSNYTDYGHTEKGGMISVGQFYKVADVLIEWCEGKNEPSEKEVLPLCGVVPSTLSDEELEAAEKSKLNDIAELHKEWKAILNEQFYRKHPECR